MTYKDVLKEPDELHLLKEKVLDFLWEIEELRDSGGTANQKQVCEYLLSYAKQIGLDE